MDMNNILLLIYSNSFLVTFQHIIYLMYTKPTPEFCISQTLKLFIYYNNKVLLHIIWLFLMYVLF
jgi:hypothetical protein